MGPTFLPRLLTCLAAAAMLIPSRGAGQAVTLETLMGAPFPTTLVAAPVGDRIAFVLNAEGVRNIYVAEGPAFEARPVTAYGSDDGQEITDLAFSADGDHVIYVRGGAPNRAGEIPNPESLPQEAERAIWTVPAAGGTPRQLAEGASPTPSPSGDRLAFLRGGGIWIVGLAEGSEARQVAAPRGSAGSLAWSPEGGRIAFSSGRGDHGFIGVLDLDAGELRYMDPTVDSDRAPAWSPDGSAIAFVRIPNRRASLPFAPLRDGHPWEIRVADPSDGSSRRIWRAAEGPGSVFQGINAPNPLMWGYGDHIVFPWEGNGWKNLYSVPAGGGSATPLSPGEFEVQFVSLSSDRRSVLYSSNQGDIDRQHVWRVPVGGGPAELLTPGAGIEWAPVTTAESGSVAFLASGGRLPAHPEVLSEGSRRWIAEDAYPEDWPEAGLVEPVQVVFPAADGMEIHGQLFLPEDARAGDRRPGVLFFHGGSRRQMLLGFHHRGYYHNAYALNQYLASLGYVVLSVNYRSGTGYGMEFREALDYGARGASEFQDVLGAGLYLRDRAEVDPERVGLWGGSYGGFLTAMGLARASDLFAAGVDLHGVHDWNVVIRNFVPSYDAAAREEVARLAFQSSPMNYVEGWRSPVLLIHGDDDRNVPFSESVDLVESLRAQGVEFEQLVFPDEVHGFLLHRNWLAAYRATVDFFQRKMGTGR
jgi:dipeptidyl aminopeptidase/acylaminoacyl peptidase